MQYFELGAFATVLFGIAETPFSRVHLSSAGHLAPLVRSADTVRQIELPHDLMLGVDPTARRATTVIELPADGALCLFTDGLVERRPTALDGDADLIAEGIDLAAGAFTANRRRGVRRHRGRLARGDRRVRRRRPAGRAPHPG